MTHISQVVGAYEDGLEPLLTQGGFPDIEANPSRSSYSLLRFGILTRGTVVGLPSLKSGVLAALVVLAASPTAGQQRVQFPSKIPTNTAQVTTPGTTYGTAPAGSAATSPSYGTTPAPAYGAGTTPGYPSGAAPSYGAGVAPSYTPGTAPGYSPGFTPGPAATFQGGIQPSTTFDPYATPGAAQPTLFPQDPTMPAYPGASSDSLTTMTRFLQEVRMDYVWIPGTASNELGVNDCELTAEFAIPFLRNPQTPLLVTPGFAFHWWSGPVSPDPLLPFAHGELPSRAYDAYLNGAWNPQLTRVLSGELAFRIGVYSDFANVDNEILRYQGYGYGLVALSPSFQLKAGVIYLDRHRYKLFPAGGVVWTPNDDVRFEILFPNPKLAIRLPGYSTTEWWFYARGEYGGGTWTVDTDPWFGGGTTRVDYNDMRFALGLDFETVRGLNGLAEVGVTFERELYYPDIAPNPFIFRPDPTVFVRGGLAY